MNERVKVTTTLASLVSLALLVGACRKVTVEGSSAQQRTDAQSRSASADDAWRARIGKVLPPGYPGIADVTFDVAVDQDVHPISPLIYGYNAPVDGARQRWGLVRVGGNRATAYNWETNASNAGSDFHFQNDSFVSTSDEPAKPLLEIIDGAKALGAATVVTLSNADWVAADKNGDGDVRQSGADYLVKRFKRNVAAKPTPHSDPPDPNDDSVYQDELVAFLIKRRPEAKLLFSMDNEPDLWSHTHAEIFPQSVTYADLWSRNQRFAAAAKKVCPRCEVLGFVSYGWDGFVSLQKAPDANGRDFVDWYLDQARAAEKQHGRRLVDYLDLHWYPEARGGDARIIEPKNDAAVVAERVQAPRSLWDADYSENSWVRHAAGEPIRLVRRMHEKIAAHYPGTKLALSEWNYGGGNHISGAVAVADVLGILGRERVGLASYWPVASDESFPFAAFRAYRNYDGNGAAFFDTSVRATSTDVAKATVYASVDRAAPENVVIVAINRDTRARRAGLRIAHSIVFAKADVYLLAGQVPEIQHAPPIVAVATNAFLHTLPPMSISVIVPKR